jgi:hypothetical protein
MSKKNRRRKPATAASASPRGRGVLGEATIPPRLATRPVDPRRGLPIPHVSEHGEGRVDFAAVDGARALECAHRRLCGLCGQPHEAQLAFIGGPGGFQQRLYTDPPGHVDFISTARAGRWLAGM